MSYYLHSDNHPAEGGDVSNNEGWWAFCDYVAELSGVDGLRHFTEYGWTDEIKVVEEDLADALRIEPPEPNIMPVAESLLSLIKQRSPKSLVMVVTDGTTDLPDGDNPIRTPRAFPGRQK